MIKFTQGITPSAIGMPLHFVIDNLKQVAYVVKSGGIVASSQVLSYDLKQMENRVPIVVCDAGSRSFESLAVDPQSRRLFAAEQPQNILELPSMKFKKFADIRIYDFNTIGACNLSRSVSLDNLSTFSKSIIKYVPDRLYICDGVCVCEYDVSKEFQLMRKFNFHNMLEIGFRSGTETRFLIRSGRQEALFIDFQLPTSSREKYRRTGRYAGSL